MLSIFCGKRFIHSSLIRYAMFIEKVPALGESITEGSIQKWMKNVNDHVVAGDVVAIVETDKVTVDIKSTVSGVLIEKLANDVVDVGMPLFKIDTSLTAISTVVPPPRIANNPPQPKATIFAHPIPMTNNHGHIPLIKFIGKRTPNAAVAPSSTDKPVVVDIINRSKTLSPIIVEKKVTVNKVASGKDITEVGAWYGRPRLSVAEAEAIESGGATLKV